MSFLTRHRLAALAMGAVLACGGAAAAQQTAPPPSSPPLAEAPVDPENLALARKLMSLLTGQMNIGAAVRTINDQMFKAMAGQTPNANAAMMDRMRAALDKAEAQTMPELFDDIAKVYARHLTRQEMEDSIAFYESPSGRSMMQKLPAIAGDLGPVMVKFLPKMRTAMVDAYCADNGCTPEQRKAMMSQGGQAGGPPRS